MSPIRCPICGSFDTIDCGPDFAPNGQHHVECNGCGCAHQMTPAEPKASGAGEV